MKRTDVQSFTATTNLSKQIYYNFHNQNKSKWKKYVFTNDLIILSPTNSINLFEFVQTKCLHFSNECFNFYIFVKSVFLIKYIAHCIITLEILLIRRPAQLFLIFFYECFLRYASKHM